MTKCVITKGEDGKLRGYDVESARAYEKFKRTALALARGQTLTFNFRLPRSPKHHAFLFAKLNILLERTEAFTKLDPLRHWLTVGAGYVDYIPGQNGQLHAIPKSLDFDSMDEAEFSELHKAVDAFLWTAQAQATLWPHLDEHGRYQCVQSFLAEFDQ